MIAADWIAERLVGLGVRHVFGVGGANIEDMFAAVQRRRPEIQAILSKHEHAAGTAADAYARLSGGLGVVLTTSGGGAMNVVHALAEARASRTPMLAILGEPPSDVQGRGAFQDTSGRGGAVDAGAIFRSVSGWCMRAENVQDIPRLLEDAIAAALGEPHGPSVLLLAKDLQQAEIGDAEVGRQRRTMPAPRPVDRAAIDRAASLLGAGQVVVVAGDEVARAGAQAQLAQLVEVLDAKVAVAPDARDAFDNRSSRFLGVAGAMGHPSVPLELAHASVCLLVGTRLPLLARQGIEGTLRDLPLISLGQERPFLASRESLHVEGDLGACLIALTTELAAAVGNHRQIAGQQTDRGNGHPAAAQASSPAQIVSPRPADVRLDSRQALAAIERALPDGSVVVVDAGNTGATAAHYLPAPRDGRWLLAMGMAGMGYSFGAAVGAALATGRRCTVLAGDGAFFMHGLDIHTAVEHDLPITYVIFNNSAHGMCLVRERLLLGENSGYNTFRRSHIGAGLAAMFPRLRSCDCRTVGELANALADAAVSRGPSVLSVELRDVEVPPFVAFQNAAGDAPTTVSRGANDEGD